MANFSNALLWVLVVLNLTTFQGLWLTFLVFLWKADKFWLSEFVLLAIRTIEASTYGNPSTLCKKKFLYRMGPVFRASLWPDQWSHSVPLGIKWKIWTLSFHWYPLVSCGFSGLDTTASQSQAFFRKVENAENWPTLLSGETQLFRHLFSNSCHS